MFTTSVSVTARARTESGGVHEAAAPLEDVRVAARVLVSFSVTAL